VHTPEPAAKRSAFEDALREFDALLEERPDDPDRMRNAALVDKNLASLAEDAGDAARQRRHAERAKTLDLRRLALRPTGRGERLDAAISLAQLASSLTSDAEARPHYERSLDLREEVWREDPADRFARTLVRRSRAQVAQVRIATGDVDGAEGAARGALELFAADEALPDGERRWQVVALATLAHAGARRGRPHEGCAQLQRADEAARRMATGLTGGDERAFATARAALPGCLADPAGTRSGPASLDPSTEEFARFLRHEG
jgi:tetratricopeptide (TPR) repeat protein